MNLNRLQRKLKWEKVIYNYKLIFTIIMTTILFSLSVYGITDKFTDFGKDDFPVATMSNATASNALLKLASIVNVRDEETFKNAIDAMKTSGSVYIILENNIQLTSVIEIPEGSLIIQALEGDMEIQSALSERHFIIRSGQKVEIILDGIFLTGSADGNLSGDNTGGGITIGANSELKIAGNKENISESGIKNCSWPDEGGAIYGGKDSTLVIENLTLSDNSSVSGGGALFADKCKTLTINECKFENNQGGEDFGGGGLSLVQTTTVITKSTFKNNESTSGLYGGGAIASHGSSVTINNSAIEKNYAPLGGGIFIRNYESSGQLKATNTEIIWNQATGTKGGGGIYSYSAAAGITLTDAVISDNDSGNGDGGGMYAHASSNISIIRTTFENNNGRNGGGAFTYDCTSVTMNNSNFINNIANANGGGIHTTTVISASNGKFTGNKAENGGAIFKGSEKRLILNMVTVTDNIATDTGGGAIGMNSHLWSTISAGGCTFKRNIAPYPNAEPLTAELQKTHDSTIFYGTTWSDGYPHAYNNADIWNTGASISLTYDENLPAGAGNPVSGMPIDDTEYAKGAFVLLPITIPICEGYTFLGWSTTANSREPDYKITGTAQSAEEQGLYHQLTGNDAAVLYAVWSRKDVSVTFDIGEGSFSAESGKRVTYSLEAGSSMAEKSLPLPEAADRFGYQFLGWFTKNGGEDGEYETFTGNQETEKWGTKWTLETEIDEDIVLYARWQQWIFYVKNESQIRTALSSQRKTINIELMNDIELTDAMRITAVHQDRAFAVKISPYNSIPGSPAFITQNGQDRHFYILSDLEVDFELENVVLDSTSGYGGFEIKTGTLTLDGNGTSAIKGMLKHMSGGAVYIHHQGALNLSNITLEANKAINSGGAVAVSDNGKLIAENLTIKNNSANAGGGVYIGANGTINMDNSELINNYASENGGGIYIADITSDVLFKDLKLTKNHAAEHGGGIGFESKSEKGIAIIKGLADSNFIFTGNTAGQYVNILADDEAFLQAAISAAGSSYYTLNGEIELNPGIAPVDNYNVMYPGTIYQLSYHYAGALETIIIDNNRYGDGCFIDLKDDTDLSYGYAKFLGWSKIVDNAASEYLDNKLSTDKALNLPANIQLYPVWGYDYHTIKFNGNGGVFPANTADLYAEIGITAELSDDFQTLTVKIRNGDYLPLLAEPEMDMTLNSHFHGWKVFDSSQSSASLDILDEAITNSYIFEASYGLIPQGYGWVSVNTAGGHPAIDSFKVESGTSISALSNEMNLLDSVEYEGHTRAGWFTYQENGEETEWDFNSLITDQQVVHLHAKWDKVAYNVRVKESTGFLSAEINNSSLNNLQDKQFLYGETINVKMLPEEGYHLNYIILESGSDTIYLQNDFQWMVKNDIILEPSFEKNLYSVTFYEKGESSPIKTITVSHGDSLNPSAIPTAPEGYEQVWEQAGGQNADFDLITEDKAFYRTLSKKHATVKFYVNTADGQWQEKNVYHQVEYGSKLGDIDEIKYSETPEKAYYDFKGWSTSEQDDLIWDLDNDIVIHDMKLYSAWNVKDAPAPIIQAATVNGEPINIDSPEKITIVAGNIAYFDITTAIAEKEPVDNSRNVITYEWYKADADGNPLYLITKTDKSQYGFSFSTPGEQCYILKAVNHNQYYSGETKSYSYSEILMVEVEYAPPEAAVPVIYTNPESIMVRVGEEASLEVEAISLDGGELSYQWYDLETNIPINGATREQLYVPTQEIGINRYYVEIYNTITIPEDKDSTSSVISNGANVTVWDDDIPQVYVVTYHANGGTSGNSPVDTNRYNDGDEIIILGNTSLRRSGYTFLGWSLSINGNHSLLYEGDIIFIDGDNINLYAQWRRNSSSGGGSDSGSTKPAETEPPVTDTSGETTEAAESETSTEIISLPPGIEIPDQEIIIPEGPRYSVAEYPGYSFIYDSETGKYIVINQEGIPLGYLNQLPVSIPKTNDTSMLAFVFILLMSSSFVIYVYVSKKIIN